MLVLLYLRQLYDGVFVSVNPEQIPSCWSCICGGRTKGMADCFRICLSLTMRVSDLDFCASLAGESKQCMS